MPHSSLLESSKMILSKSFPSYELRIFMETDPRSWIAMRRACLRVRT